jgi:Cyclic nucleotide-binding domain
MRVASSVTSVSWIPVGAVEGFNRLAFDVGIAHYDQPPPDAVDDVADLVANDAVRFVNDLKAWIEVDGGRIVDYGHSGRGLIGSTRVRLGPTAMVFPGVPFPDLRPDPEVREDSVRFVQTVGGRTGVPMPRPLPAKPYVRIAAPPAWSTLALTIHADGSSEHEVIGASRFPRHWVYDDKGQLVAKTGFIDFDTWFRESLVGNTPWGDEESPAIVTAVESALERELSRAIIGSKPPFRRLRAGEHLVEQGEPGEELFLLFDGVLEVVTDGKVIAEVGPGAILGEMALLEQGHRTATLRAVTPCRVAVVPGDQVDRDALDVVARGRRQANAQGGGTAG